MPAPPQPSSSRGLQIEWRAQLGFGFSAIVGVRIDVRCRTMTGEADELAAAVRKLRQRFESSPPPVRAALLAPLIVGMATDLARSPRTDGLVGDLVESAELAHEIRDSVVRRRSALQPPDVQVVIVDELRLFMDRLNSEVERRSGITLVRTSDSSYRCPTAKGARVSVKYYPPPSQVGVAGAVLVEAWVRFSDARSGELNEHRLSDCFGPLGDISPAISARGGWHLRGLMVDRYVDLTAFVPAMQVMADLIAYFGTPGSITEFMRCRNDLRTIRTSIFQLL